MNKNIIRFIDGIGRVLLVLYLIALASSVFAAVLDKSEVIPKYIYELMTNGQSTLSEKAFFMLLALVLMSGITTVLGLLSLKLYANQKSRMRRRETPNVTYSRDIANLTMNSKTTLRMPYVKYSKGRKYYGYNEEFFTNLLDRLEIDIDKIEVQNDLAFLILPFKHDIGQVNDIIGEACREIKITLEKTDQNLNQEDFFHKNIENIIKAVIIIANLDDCDPCVFYELSVARELNKPIVLVTRANMSISCRSNDQQLILYKDYKELKEQILDILECPLKPD